MWMWLLPVIVIVIAGFMVYQYIAQRLLQVETLTIHPTRAQLFADELPRRVVFFSDLHNHMFGQDNKRLVEAIRAQEPDLILIPGDLLVGHRAHFEVAARLLQDLAKLGKPIYISLGNHESGTREHHPDLYEEFLQDSVHDNIHILDNRTEYIAEHVAVCGLTLPMSVYSKRGRRVSITQEDMEKITPQPRKEDFRILMAHTPYYFDTYAEYGADLVLSGHIHGGIVRFPLLGGLISPQMELFPEYDAGVYEKNGAMMVVTRGLGTHFPPIRIANRPELIVLQFKVEDPKDPCNDTV